MVHDPVCGMTVDEKTSLSIRHEGEVHYFCSRRCLEKFASERGLSVSGVVCPPAGCKPVYKNKVFLVAGALLALLGASFFFEALVPFRASFLEYFHTIWLAVLIGLFLGGVIDHYIPREYISRVLSSPRKRTVFSAVILGFFMSACSHGILALSIELHKKGASNAAVVAFLLASPWANFAVTIMLLAFFGAKAFYILASAVFVALTTGLIFQRLERLGWVESNTQASPMAEQFSIWSDIKKRARAYRMTASGVRADVRGVLSGSAALADMVLWWILIGVGVASLIGAYVPEHIFHRFAGPTFLGMLVTLGIATIIEVCSEGSAPMAFEIFKQTGALGNSFVFLMAGVVTDYTEIGLLWHNVGRRVALWLPVVAVPQVVLLGIIANIIFK
ncbi:MAG: permease [Candidatus Omnitrophota bacterium]